MARFWAMSQTNYEWSRYFPLTQGKLFAFRGFLWARSIFTNGLMRTNILCWENSEIADMFSKCHVLICFSIILTHLRYSVQLRYEAKR